MHNMRAMTPADVTSPEPTGVEQFVAQGMQLKSLHAPRLVSRARHNAVCRFNSVWSKPGEADVRAVLLVKMKSGPNGTTDVEANVE